MTASCPHGVSNVVCWTCYVLEHPMPELRYTEWIAEMAAVMGSDGCTAAGSLYRWCCFEHDIHYNSGIRRDGTPIGKAAADEQFRSCLQRHSAIGWYSPLAWWRWLAVRKFGDPTMLRALFQAGPTKAASRRAQIIRETLP